jgi:hypothetical protein
MENFTSKLISNFVEGINILNSNKPKCVEYNHFVSSNNSIKFGTNKWVDFESKEGKKLQELGWYMYNGLWNFNIYSENGVPDFSPLSKLKNVL